MTKYNYRRIQNFLMLPSFFVFFASIYFQYVAGLQPCPLCLMERLCVFLLLILLGLSLTSLRRAHFITLLQTLIASAGLFFSLRQLWLQTFPAGKAPACLPGLDVLIKYFPWQTVARVLFWGSAECAEVSWSLLGISMPGWGAIYFFFMVVAGIYLYLRTRTLA